jgi:plastocyanin
MKKLFLFLSLTALAGICTAKVHVVNVDDDMFTPSTLTIEKGDTVSWHFIEEEIHTTTSGSNCTGDGTWNSDDMTANQTFDYRFGTTGTFPYFCIHHCSMGMTGTITVTEPTTGINSQNKLAGNTTLKNYPNPFNNITTFNFSAAKSGKAELQILSLDGRVVNTQTVNVKAGQNSFPVTLDLPSGMYLVKLDMNGIISRSRIIARKE